MPGTVFCTFPEAQSYSLTCPKSHNWWQSQDANPGSLSIESTLLTTISDASLAWFKDVTELKDKPFNLFSGALLCEVMPPLAVPSALVRQPRARLFDSPSFWTNLFLVSGWDTWDHLSSNSVDSAPQSTISHDPFSRGVLWVPLTSLFFKMQFTYHKIHHFNITQWFLVHSQSYATTATT